MEASQTDPKAPFVQTDSESKYATSVAEDRMITSTESLIRQSIGAVFLTGYAWQSYLMYSNGNTTSTEILRGTPLAFLGNGYILLSALAGTAFGFWQTGRQNL